MNAFHLSVIVAIIAGSSSALFLGSAFGATGNLVDLRLGTSDYHFSWRHDGGQAYDWVFANQYCASLGLGWSGLDIESYEEDLFMDYIIAGEGLQYIWTGGSLSGSGWNWSTGAPFYGLDWSRTGGNGYPQPDNREGNEYCLAVLNNFYNDGVTWHDVACHHRKPIICERKQVIG